MALSIKVVAKTTEVGEQTTDLFTLGGKMAGVCYMPEDYFDGKIQDTEKAQSRANMTSSSGHHSVFDHGNITFQISGIPKIMAMLLNSTEQYTTSEKSARYTVMKPETELEEQIYEKWKHRFEERIAEVYPEIDEKTRAKLALENARYLISVFTPTHMMWTTSFRQVAYVITWLDKLQNSSNSLEGDFNQKISSWCKLLKEEFISVIPECMVIKENKNRTFEFMTYQATGKQIDAEEVIGDMYQTTYLASFAQLAQLHRHRTIHYELEFSGDSALEYGVYIPPIIRNTVLEALWLADFERVAYCYPQGTMVKVLEQGRALKFFDKCKERLCGRAQLEVAYNTKELMEKFIYYKHRLSSGVRQELEKVTLHTEVCTKCAMKDITCMERCMWGASQGLNRLI